MNAIGKSRIGAVLLLVIGGIIKLPVEQWVTDDFRQAELLPPRMERGLREAMSQETFAAAAGGLRSLLASGYEIAAFQEFAQQPPRFDLVEKYYALCCQLQPREWRYWDMRAWMLSRNAGSYYGEEGGASKGLEATERRKWRERGLKVLAEGINLNPDAYMLYRNAGFLLSEKNHILNPTPNHVAAARVFKRGSETSTAKKPPGFPAKYMYRFFVYELAQIPGAEREAYARLMELYAKGDSEKLPSSIKWINEFEYRFDVPLALRISEQMLQPKPLEDRVNHAVLTAFRQLSEMADGSRKVKFY